MAFTSSGLVPKFPFEFREWLDLHAEARLVCLPGTHSKWARVDGGAITGFKVVEVTLNSEEPLRSIELLAQHFDGKMAVGAGTVTSPEQVEQVHAAGGKLVVSPSVHAGVISESVRLGMYSLPGALTPTECFQAIDAGADGLKVFPASILGPSGLGGVMAVLPKGIPVLAVGGVTVENLGEWFDIGVRGVGLGSNIYHMGDSPEQVFDKASAMLAAYAELGL